jgi:hypothetical protein
MCSTSERTCVECGKPVPRGGIVFCVLYDRYLFCSFECASIGGEKLSLFYVTKPKGESNGHQG